MTGLLAWGLVVVDDGWVLADAVGAAGLGKVKLTVEAADLNVENNKRVVRTIGRVYDQLPVGTRIKKTETYGFVVLRFAARKVLGSLHLLL